MNDLNELSIDELAWYRQKLEAEHGLLMGAMGEGRRLKPTLEIGNDGAPIQKGESGKEMVDNAEHKMGFTLEDIKKKIQEVDAEMLERQKAIQNYASLNGISSLWLKREGSRKVKWYD